MDVQELKEMQPIKVRKIDFSKFPVAANRTVTDLVERSNKLLEIVIAQQEEINKLKALYE